MCGCGLVDEDDTVSEEVLCRVEILEVADSTDWGDPITVYMAGIVGPDSCYHLDRIERENMGRRWVLRPIAHHLVPPCACCTKGAVCFAETVSLQPVDSGWAIIEAESRGPLLTDSTYVRPPPAPPDTFTYMCYYVDSLAVTGWFTMEEPEPGSIRGEWHFGYVHEPVDVGPQVGDGILVGTIEADRIMINLNPGWHDYNVNLDGVLTDNRYVGKWTYSVFTGLRSQGRFEATRTASP
jgi:hypothetical protein